MPLDRHKTVKEALAYVGSNPQWPDIPTLDVEIWEIVARNLYEHANNPNTREVGSMSRATRAQRIILDRTTGTRRAGTNPAVAGDQTVTLKDLTGGRSDDEQ